MNQLAVTLWAGSVVWCWYNYQIGLALILGAYLLLYVVWAIKIDWQDKKALNGESFGEHTR